MPPLCPTEKPRALIIGYGNIHRADDGVAHQVINALRRLQGRAPLAEGNTGLEELGKEVDEVFVSQLAPELMELLGDYSLVIFVDAHVYPTIDDLYCRPVTPDSAQPILTHHITPGLLLALVKAIYGHEPIAELVSVRGYDLNFHRGLSIKTRSLAPQAVDYIVKRLNAHGHDIG